MVLHENFHEELERDLQRLTAEIKDKQALAEFEKKTEKELLKESLRTFQEGEVTPENKLKKIESTEKEKKSSGKKVLDNVLPSYLKTGKTPSEVEMEIERLISMVFNESLSKAIKEAQKQPPFIADAFHDALVDKLLPILKERGII